MLGAAPASLLDLDMSAAHGGYEGAHVSAARQPIKSFVYTSKKASFAAHMASSTVSLSALESRCSTSKDCVGQVKRPVLNPIQLATHALGAQHALPQDHALASSKDKAIGTLVPLVVLSARGDCGRQVYTRALSDARASAYPAPGLRSTNPPSPGLTFPGLTSTGLTSTGLTSPDLPSPEFTPPCSSSSYPNRDTKPTVLSAHPLTTMEFSSTHKFPFSRETLKLWKRGRHPNIATSCFCSLKPCVCIYVTSKIRRHNSEESQRAATRFKYPHVSPSSIVSSSPSLSPSIPINTMTPTVETPSCAYTNIQPTNYFKKDHQDHQEEEHQQPDSAYMTESPCAPCLCPCEPQPFNALRMSFVSSHPCMECTLRKP